MYCILLHGYILVDFFRQKICEFRFNTLLERDIVFLQKILNFRLDLFWCGAFDLGPMRECA